MKKRALTISIISGVLNCPPSFAHDVVCNNQGNEKAVSMNSNYLQGSFKVQNLEDQLLANELAAAVSQVNLVANRSSSFVEKSGDNLESALENLKIKVADLDNQYPEHSLDVKGEILAELLKKQVLKVDEDFGIGLNDNILEALQDRGIVEEIYAAKGTICF